MLMWVPLFELALIECKLFIIAKLQEISEYCALRVLNRNLAEGFAERLSKEGNHLYNCNHQPPLAILVLGTKT